MHNQNHKLSNNQSVLPLTPADNQIRKQEKNRDETKNLLQSNAQAEQWEAKIGELLKDEAFLERYIFADKHICDAVIRRYLLKLNGNRGVQTLSSVFGECALPAVKRPKTLSEAKQLADTFIAL